MAGDDTGNAVVCGHLDIRELKFKGKKVVEGRAVKPLRRWMVLRQDFVLYSYKSAKVRVLFKENKRLQKRNKSAEFPKYDHLKDPRALAGIVLLGSSIEHGPEELGQDDFIHKGDEDKVIKMFQRSHHFVKQSANKSSDRSCEVKRVYYFEAKSARDAAK